MTKFFDTIHDRFESHAGHAIIGSVLVTVFLMALMLIELNRQQLLPASLAGLLPTNHLVAISFSFTLLLFFEVVSLTFTLAKSVTTSVGKQFEILALILLRNVFKELSKLDEPISWMQVEPIGSSITAQAVAALLIFVILGFYYRLHEPKPITTLEKEKQSFINAKKIIALGLLFTFAAILIRGVWAMVYGLKVTSPFEAFYTTLIFTDILIVLISLRSSSRFHVAFRNSAFTVSTVMIRLSLIAPALYASALGVGTALYALGVSYAYCYFAPVMDMDKE